MCGGGGVHDALAARRTAKMYKNDPKKSAPSVAALVLAPPPRTVSGAATPAAGSGEGAAGVVSAAEAGAMAWARAMESGSGRGRAATSARQASKQISLLAAIRAGLLHRVMRQQELLELRYERHVRSACPRAYAFPPFWSGM